MTTAFTIPPDLIEQLAAAVAQKIGQAPAPAPIPVEFQLWSTENIATYLRRSRSTVRDEVVHLPSFPKPVRLPTASKQRSQALYKAPEVIAWAARHQSK